ncbi:putative disease resistance protein At4g11170 [Cynara cardunculus var. scolymus]|uniref:putative disease resistance protein At4g11170 n=1 Tax=Cynara cardunculus var. scolymus TaxID=59895 RepID=UPI000D62646B|nr:putative disease resistance protein At4g11170 [Cynara cardunculus var. scolymus]
MGNASASTLTSSHGDNATSYDDSTIMTSPGDNVASYVDSSIMDSSRGVDATCYDVFLSFRGEDTRDSFTDHLYEALQRAGFLTFRDDDEINKGRELKPEIEMAIKASKASVVVLSENFATSTWCLDELCLILEQRRERNHFVLPVFYHVDPSDVRKQDKTFKIQVKAFTRWTHENVNRWKAALTKVADFASIVVSGLETKFLKDIVDTIYSELDHKIVHLPRYLTGMDIRYEEITSWLYESDLKYLVICGMGGSGKTTLAKYIFNSSWKKFENMSFIEDIGRKCKESHDLLEPQIQLLKDILGGRERKIPSVSYGTCKIEEALQTKRALIVLDGIVEERQLVALLGTGEINPRSKIIITTENIDNWFMSSPRFQQYKMKLLNDNESLELLSLNAFGCKIPTEGFKELAAQAVKYCEGNPLALEVLGSSLSKSNTIPYWKSQLRTLTKDIHSRIQDVLKRGYDSLPFASEKGLFLHIACFFIGKDLDYVEKILEPDYSAVSGIKTLINRCLVSVSPSNKLMMHRLLQEMGRNVVRQESFSHPEKRSRVWLSSDSYKILKKGKGSETIEGLTLDMKMLREEEEAKTFVYPSGLWTDALELMDNLKLLQLNFVELNGSYENFSVDLRWLCWLGFHLRTIPSDLFMGNLVAVDMSYSNLEVFDPPMVLHSLQILNLKDSHNLFEIRNIYKIPLLETLILWNCNSLVHVCETIGDLNHLTLLNMTGCHSLCKREKNNLLEASTSGKEVTIQPPFSFPQSLERLFLNDCKLECTDYLPLSFDVQPFLQYLNLSNGLFEFLPYYHHLINLRVLDLTFSSRLKWLLCLPNTLAELYVYSCKSLEKITFQSPRFTLQEFGYSGCINLAEIEGFIKLVPIAKLDESDLGHMKWLKEYQNHEVLLVGDDELTLGRSLHVQMLYEFDIMSTSLPDVEDSNMMPEYISESPFLFFDVPSCSNNKRIKGLNVTFRYTLSGDDGAWFAKISTDNGVDLMYNPKVYGKPDSGEVGIWVSYWPIRSAIDVGDKVNVSIVVLSGLMVRQCGASLVYADDEEEHETLEKNTGWVETLGGNLSGFQLSTGAYYLCRRDLFELMEVGRLTPHWFRILFGDTIDYTEVQGWRKTGRPKRSNPSYTELKTVRCIIHGPEQEEIYKIAEMSKSSLVDKNVDFTSSILGVGDMMKSGTISEIGSATRKEESESYNLETIGMSDSDETTESALKDESKSAVIYEVSDEASLTTVAGLKGFSVSTYDVYLSFKGEDTRHSFTDHLYETLVQAGIRPCKDDADFKRGEDVWVGIKRAIRESKGSIVVLSENYATSTWCLEELSLILEQRRECDYFVLPVFYHVKPSDVRKQTKTFNIEVKTSTRWTHDNVERWKAALTEVANLAGLVLPFDTRSETEFLKTVVKTILKEIDRK